MKPTFLKLTLLSVALSVAATVVVQVVVRSARRRREPAAEQVS